MIFKFRLISDEVKDFAREVLIESDNTFLEFHKALQENLEYDEGQLASFFITNEKWEKELQITLIDMMDEESEKVITMDKTMIGDYMKKQGQRLLYVFDFFSERSFFIELSEIITNLKSQALPKVVFSHGMPPPQIDLGVDNLDPGVDLGEDPSSPDDKLDFLSDLDDIEDLPNE